MATETVLDYLGHPCQIAKAKDHFEEPLKEARLLDARHLVSNIGGHLNGLDHRHQQLSAALSLAHRLLLNAVDSEDDSELALLEMAISYHSETMSELFAVSGQVLAALERGQLEEVAHG